MRVDGYAGRRLFGQAAIRDMGLTTPVRGPIVLP